MRKKYLIVNADDCNLTPAVTRGIVEAHHQGIVSSTTFLVNLDCRERDILMLKKTDGLGVGLHLNVTLGKPVSASSQIKTLLSESRFKRPSEYLKKHPKASEVYLEYTNQIKKFKRVFGCLPTHLDTHHQLHDHPFFMRVLARVATEHKLPVRRSALMHKKNHSAFAVRKKLQTTDYLAGDLDARNYWRKTALLKTLKTLRPGVTEIMCHPARVDKTLMKISSFNADREKELRVMTDEAVIKQIKKTGIELTHYGLCYT